MITHSLYQTDILSINDLSLEQINEVLDLAQKFKSGQVKPFLKDKIIAHCFFEPSTRTRLSFETASLRLGGKVIGFSSGESLSISKGETLSDTMRMLSSYADLIILRHPNEGAARLAAEISRKPVINAGDGANQHPTQTLVDLFTIRECQNSLEGLAIALVGDLKYGRTIRSLAQGCKKIGARIFFVSSELLRVSKSICDELKKQGVRFSFHQTIEEVLPKIDILYMTRIQKERFVDLNDSLVAKQLVLNKEMLNLAKKNLRILHPLPRRQEMDKDVDHTPYAYYFEQAANAVFVRQALLTLIINKEIML